MFKNEEHKAVVEKYNGENIFGKISFLIFILPFLLVIFLSILDEIISTISMFNLFTLFDLDGDDMTLIILGVQLFVITIFVEFSIFIYPLGIILALVGLLHNTPRKFAVYGLLGNTFLFYILNKWPI